LTELKNLFQPIHIGEMELKNRIIFLAVATGYGADDGVTDRQKNFYIERARGGAGLLITGITMPSSLGRPLPGMMGIYHDRFIPGLRQLTDAVHAHGAKIAVQLGIQYWWAKGEGAPMEEVAPSEVSTRRDSAPRALTIEEIRQLIDDFSEGVRRACEAGFDAVEFHCGIGYLINRFLSSCTNKRTDQYGGSLENRMRFLLEIIESSKKKAGSDYPIICRISGEEFMEGGHTLEDSKKLAPILEKAGVHCLSMQVGWHECRTPLVHMSVPRGAFVYIAEEIKKVVNIPVVAAYRINDPILADSIIAEGRADLIGMGRPLIADPELPNKAKEGRFDDIRLCIACGHCLDTVMGVMPMACAVNPQVGKEAEYAIEPAKGSKRVFVIGGGPAGMEAAAVAAQRGHQVTLFEKKDRLGGNLHLAALLSYKGEIGNLANYLETQVKKSGAQIRLGEELTVEAIEEGKPDAVILATGTNAKAPDLPGFKGDNVALALDVLTGKKVVGERVIVVGGEMVGCEVAEFLAENGKQVTLLARRERVGDDIGRTARWVIMQRLRNAGIRMETKVDVVEITDEGVRGLRRNGGESEFFEGDSVVLAVGLASSNELAQKLEGKVPAIYSIGDCAEVRKIAEAIEDGFRVAREI